MRWLLVIVVLAFGGSAHAHRPPPMLPRLSRECPRAASWSAVLDCLKLNNLVGTIIGTLDDAKLVSVTVANTEHDYEATAVYVRTGDAWHLGGLVSASDPAFVLVRFEHAGRGYRVDFAATLTSAVSVDGLTAVPAVYREILATVCNGGSFRCVQVVPYCEQIVHGQTVSVFDGVLTVHDNTLSLKGVGSQPSCGIDIAESTF